MKRWPRTTDVGQRGGRSDHGSCVIFRSSDTAHQPHPESAEAACLSSAGLRRAPCHRDGAQE
jgi:hypothetical protein